MFTGRLVSRVKLRNPLSRVKNLYRRKREGEVREKERERERERETEGGTERELLTRLCW